MLQFFPWQEKRAELLPGVLAERLVQLPSHGCWRTEGERARKGEKSWGKLVVAMPANEF